MGSGLRFAVDYDDEEDDDDDDDDDDGNGSSMSRLLSIPAVVSGA
jgi:hypothetical protein